MYIKKYWGSFIGGSDDSLHLVAFLEDQKKEEIPLSEIFAKIGLDKQNWDFRQTVEYLEFTHSDGVEMDFHFQRQRQCEPPGSGRVQHPLPPHPHHRHARGARRHEQGPGGFCPEPAGI